jgi:hypothetical protein
MSISLPQRVPENAPGDFYVQADLCTCCCIPHNDAPELLNAVTDGMETCYFRRQPQTPEEVEQAIMAISVSCVGGPRYGGSDQSIIRRLHEKGCADQCDQPLLGEPVRLPRRSLWMRLIAALRVARS